MNEDKITDIKKALLKTKNKYLSISSKNYSTDEFMDKVANELKNGVDIVEYYEKDKPPKQIIEIGRKLRQLCSIYDALFILYDRIDIAKILDCDGVIVGIDDINIAFIKDILDKDKLIGIKIKNYDEISYAKNSNPDFITIENDYRDELNKDDIIYLLKSDKKDIKIYEKY